MEKNRQIDKQLLSLILSERLPDSDWDSFSPTDWELIVHLAVAESVAPLLYWALSQAGKISLLPKPLRNSLRAAYYSTKMKNEQIIEELGTLAGRFDHVGISIVALKGICFALTIYPDIGLRPMADLDLLVPGSSLSEAVGIAESLGYVEAVPEVFPGLATLLCDEITLQKTTAPFMMLELHNSLLADKSFSYAVPVDWFWSQTEPLTALHSEMAWNELRMLTPDAQLLYAAAHIMLKHGRRPTPLRWYYDLDRLIRCYAEWLDWDLILRQAKAFQWGSALQAALSRTCDYFGTPLPNNVIADLSKNTDRHGKLIRLKQDSSSTRILEEYQNLMERKWYGRLIALLGLIAPSPAYMRWRYGLKSSGSLPGWYLYRWWSMFSDLVDTVKMLMKNNRSQSLPSDVMNRTSN